MWGMSAPWVPCGAELKPWTSLAEFSVKKRWRYMMRTSAWQLRFSTSGESLMRREKPSAAIVPSSESPSREKSWRIHTQRVNDLSLCVCVHTLGRKHTKGYCYVCGRACVCWQKSLRELTNNCSRSDMLKRIKKSQISPFLVVPYVCAHTPELHFFNLDSPLFVNQPSVFKVYGLMSL